MARTKHINPAQFLAKADVLEAEDNLARAEAAGEDTQSACLEVRLAYEAAYEAGLTDAQILGELPDTLTSL